MLTDIRLQHFRSYDSAVFELGDSVNIIVGPNGSGKTNLLESILIVSRGSSYRTKDASLVKLNESWARIDAHTNTGSTRTVKLTPDSSPSKEYIFDGKTYRRLSLDRTLPAVLFEPDHLRLLSGGPDRRRDYLDDLLERTIAGYSGLRKQFGRALAQRNSLLKKPGSTVDSAIFPWNVRMSELGGQVARHRQTLVEKMNKQMRKLYKDLSGGKDVVELRYLSGWPIENYESRLLMALESTIDQDLIRGFTGAGPHREDLEIAYNSQPASLVVSRGEARTIILALKTLELNYVEEARGIKPLLLLDDVYSELDGKRRHLLTDQMSKYQTFITTTEADLVVQHLTSTHNIIAIER